MHSIWDWDWDREFGAERRGRKWGSRGIGKKCGNIFGGRGERLEKRVGGVTTTVEVKKKGWSCDLIAASVDKREKKRGGRKKLQNLMREK